MTELSLPDDSAAAQPHPEWPAGGQTDVTDQVVQECLAPLEGLPKTPVSVHEAVYNDLHDQLREALDRDPADLDTSAAGRRNTNPAAGVG